MPRPGDEPFEIDEAEVLARGDDAILVKADIFKEPEWIPHSMIHDDSEILDEAAVGEIGKLVVKQWLAEKRGWC